MIMSFNHLLDTIDLVSTISPMKNKASLEKKIKLYRQGAKHLKETTDSSEELDSEYNLKVTPNQFSHILQIFPIYPRKVAHNFETR